MARSSDHLSTRLPVDASATPIDRAIAYGCNAPNTHNPRGWKLRNVSGVEAVLYVDETRLLPATDPTAQHIHIGCGCFIERWRRREHNGLRYDRRGLRRRPLRP
jgi:hypothetical protein